MVYKEGVARAAAGLGGECPMSEAARDRASLRNGPAARPMGGSSKPCPRALSILPPENHNPSLGREPSLHRLVKDY